MRQGGLGAPVAVLSTSTAIFGKCLHSGIFAAPAPLRPCPGTLTLDQTLAILPAPSSQDVLRSNPEELFAIHGFIPFHTP